MKRATKSDAEKQRVLGGRPKHRELSCIKVFEFEARNLQKKRVLRTERSCRLIDRDKVGEIARSSFRVGTLKADSGNCVVNAGLNWEPVETFEQTGGTNMMGFSKNHPCCTVLNALEFGKLRVREAIEKSIAVVKA